MSIDKIIKLLEILPAVGFILVMTKHVDLMVGTIIAMGLSTLFVTASKLTKSPLSKFQVGTWMAILVFGTLTLVLQNEVFIKLKTTVVNGTLSTLFLISHVFFKKTLVEYIFEAHLSAPRHKLRMVNVMAIFYFAFIAVLNYWVLNNLSNENWAMFKVVGISILNILFTFSIIVYLREHLKDYFNKIENKK